MPAQVAFPTIPWKVPREFPEHSNTVVRSTRGRRAELVEGEGRRTLDEPPDPERPIRGVEHGIAVVADHEEILDGREPRLDRPEVLGPQVLAGQLLGPLGPEPVEPVGHVGEGDDGVLPGEPPCGEAGYGGGREADRDDPEVSQDVASRHRAVELIGG